MAEVIEHPASRGPGRPKGSRNRIKKEVAQVFDPVARRMTRKLERRFDAELGKGDACNLDFCQKLYALACSYAWGQPVKRNEVSGPDGGPIQKQTQILEASQRVAEAFSEAAGEDTPADQLSDDSLRAVQAVSFITAAKEATQANGSSAPSGEAAVPSSPPSPREVRPESPTNHTAASRPVNIGTRETQARQVGGRSSKAGGIKNLASKPAEPEPADQVGTHAGPVNPEPQPPEPGASITLMDSGLRIVGLKPDREGLPLLYALHGSAGLMRRGNWETILASARKHAGGEDLGPFVIQQPKHQIQPLRPDQKPFAVPFSADRRKALP